MKITTCALQDDAWDLTTCPHREHVECIETVYVYDADLRVHVCEFAASAELHYVRAQVQFKPSSSVLDDAALDEVDNWLNGHNQEEAVSYVHYSSLARLFEHGARAHSTRMDIETIDEAVEAENSNWSV